MRLNAERPRKARGRVISLALAIIMSVAGPAYLLLDVCCAYVPQMRSQFAPFGSPTWNAYIDMPDEPWSVAIGQIFAGALLADLLVGIFQYLECLGLV